MEQNEINQQNNINIAGNNEYLNQGTESTLSIQSETTESTRSLVQRKNIDNKRTEEENADELQVEESDQNVMDDDVIQNEREMSPESDTTAAPSIGPVVLRNIKKRRKIKRVCMPDEGRCFTAVYAVVLIIIGVAFPLRDAIKGVWIRDYVAVAYNTYLYAMAILFLLGLEIHLLKRSAKRAKIQKERDKLYPSSSEGTLKKSAPANYNPAFERDSVFINEMDAMHVNQSYGSGLGNTGSQADICIVEQDDKWDQPLPHRTSLFLRMGVAIFGICTLIYFGLLVKQLHESYSAFACGSDIIIWPYYILLLFIFVQTFFLFKRPQVHIKGCSTIVRLGFMHVFATNICIWTHTVVREVLNAYLLQQNNWRQQSNKTNTSLNNPSINTTSVSVGKTTWSGCIVDRTDDDLLDIATPYLLAPVFEFCLLCSAACYSLWSDVAFSHKIKVNEKGRRRSIQFDLPDTPVHLTEISFHKTHRGLFSGFIILAAVAVSIILFFSYLNNSDDMEIPKLIYICTDIGIYTILIIALTITWFYIALLKYNYQRKITVDEFLLFVAMTGMLIYNICYTFAIIDSLINESRDRDAILSLCDCMLCMVLVILQTCMIVEGFSRQSERSKHLKDKPGRGGVTFLLIANIAVWLLRSFQLKYVQVQMWRPELAMFGHLIWQIVTYGLVPFMAFYHFQSSACLAHIWGKCYRKDPPREGTPSIASDNITEAVTLVPTSGEIRIVELKRRIRKSTGVTEEDTVFSPVSVV